MSISRRFRQLKKRLDELRLHLLPKDFSPVGQYSEKQYDLARAYLVLVHAEIEAYCEDRCRRIAQQAHGTWKKYGRHTRILTRLMKYHNVLDRKPWKPIDRTPAKVESAVNSYLNSLISNHGIREDNLFRILFPVGIEADDLDSTWLATMDSFGIIRGDIAHKSVKTLQQIDPATEFERIRKQILPGLKKLDRRTNRM